MAGGVLAIDKPAGPTSHDVVARVRRLLRLRRVGHCGTLDPLATGVLVLCLGRFTRLTEFLSGADKVYRADILLGGSTDTYDAQGTVQPRLGVRPPAPTQVQQALAAFVGDQEQVPPPISAVKVNGVRSYRAARQGRPVRLEARPIRIHQLALERYCYPELRITVTCSKGTYIRSLAHDLGEALGCGAYVQALRRLRSGGVTEARCVSLESLTAAVTAGTTEQFLLPVEEALPDVARLTLAEPALRLFATGAAVTALDAVPTADVCLVFDAAGRCWGLGSVDGAAGVLQPRKVMVPPAAAGGPGGGPHPGDG